MPRLLFLTNPHNGASEEDAYLIEKLRRYGDVTVSHPVDCAKFLEGADSVVIRNIWPTHEYLEQWRAAEQLLRTSGIRTYNPLSGKADIRGKDYLAELMKIQLPVIPSVLSIKEINSLPNTGDYWIKPKRSCDGVGSEKLSLHELQERNLHDYVIQPYIEFDYEVLFFFIDNIFSHALTQRHRLHDQEIQPYTPTNEDLVFAHQFIDWNGLPYGVQRVDAVRTKDGKLLLTEVEDIAPYLYLLEVPEDIRDMFTQKLVASIRENLVLT